MVLTWSHPIVPQQSSGRALEPQSPKSVNRAIAHEPRYGSCGRICVTFAAIVAHMSIPIFSLSHAARLLGVSSDTVRRWADAGRLPSGTDSKGRRIIDGADLAGFARSLADEPGERGTSARNSFPGLVTRVQIEGIVAQVDIQAGPHRVVSLMTREAAEELDLAPGVEVVALVKAPAVVVDLP